MKMTMIYTQVLKREATEYEAPSMGYKPVYIVHINRNSQKRQVCIFRWGKKC